MGTDIHLYVEQEQKDGSWEMLTDIDEFSILRYQSCLADAKKRLIGCPDTPDRHDERTDIRKYIQTITNWLSQASKEHTPDFLYSDRNYVLFAALAGVRNGLGVAGVDTGDPLTPVDEPRGLPTDVSDEVAKEETEWGCDGHSHSYLYLQELLDYDWDQPVVQRGVVSQIEFKRWEETGRPRMWSGGVAGSNVHNISNEQMRERISAEQPCDGYYTRIQWTQPLRELVRDFLPAIEKLKKLSGGDTTAVRIVFWFDN